MICFLLTSYICAISSSFLSTFLIPATVFVHTRGKHIKKQMNIGEFVDENQINASIIKDITGVDLIATIAGFNIS